MLVKVYSGTTSGIEGVLIEVEVDVAGKGFPTFTIVGLPSKAIDEAKDRVRTAINNTSFAMPDSRLTVNLAPADIPKEGSGFDLPIAIGIMAASGYIDKNFLSDSLFVGELSLEGKIRSVPGTISIALLAKKRNIKNIFVPVDNVKEAILVEGVNVYAVDNLTDMTLFLNGEKQIDPWPSSKILDLMNDPIFEYDFKDIKGQNQAKRALEIAAAGFHNIHLKGVPGTGKTLLSRAFPSILPPMDKEEILEVSKIYSVTGLLRDKLLIVQRPFRSPHHTTSRIGLIGGGTNPIPGEISLAHKGVLFMDELTEFPRSVLESLRQPLEDGCVTISRASGSLTFPTRFIFLSASNPCPCGFLGHPKKNCHCSPGLIMKYKKRLSGPLLDRIDLHVDVAPVEVDRLTDNSISETSSKIRERVIAALNRQRKRFADTKIKTNGEMKTGDIRKHCKLTDNATNLLKIAISKLSLSARSYFKIIKISQTIADLKGRDRIESTFVAEALQYRAKDD